MIVTVKNCNVQKKTKALTGETQIYTVALVLFDDKATAARIFIPEEICDPSEIYPGGQYDLYRDEKGYCLVFDKVEKNDSRS